MSFVLDDDGLPVSTKPYITRESNHLIEEFMLLANRLVAKQLLDNIPELAMLRSHPPPLARRALELEQFVSKFGFDVSTRSAGALLKVSRKYLGQRRMEYRIV
eukprot:390129_1